MNTPFTHVTFTAHNLKPLTKFLRDKPRPEQISRATWNRIATGRARSLKWDEFAALSRAFGKSFWLAVGIDLDKIPTRSAKNDHQSPNP